MRSLLLQRGKKLLLSERRRGEPGAGEVRLKVEACAVGDDDLDSWFAGTGKLPRVPGSEILATVDAVGATAELRQSNIISFFGQGRLRVAPGDRVVVNPYLPVAGSGDVVKLGLDADGGLQQYINLPAEQCLAVEESADRGHLLCLPALGEAVSYLKELAVTAGETVIVFGAGGLGLFVSVAAQLEGAKVMLVDTREASLEQARAVGVEHTVNPFRSSLLEELEWIAPSAKAEVVVETSGEAEVMPGLLAACAPGSRIGFVKPLFQDVSVTTLVERGLRLVGLGTLLPDLKEGLALSRRCDLSPAVSVSLGLEELPGSFTTLAKGKAPLIRAMVLL